MDNTQLSKELINFMIFMKKHIKSQFSSNIEIKFTEQQFMILFALKKYRKIALKKLSTYVNVSTSSLCIMLTRMMEEGLVSREVDKSDRRNTFYSLTEMGKNLIDKEIERKVENIKENISSLSLNEKEKLYQSIKTIEEIIYVLE